MISIKRTRPHFPPGYVENPRSYLEWDEVAARLNEAVHYWFATARPDGRPHVVPKWAVWVDEHIYFDGSPQTRHARNLAANPNIVVHLESGAQAVILEGTACALERPSKELAQAVAAAYKAKYAGLGYAPQPDQWDQGGLFEIAPATVIAWTSFADNPTKFILR